MMKKIIFVAFLANTYNLFANYNAKINSCVIKLPSYIYYTSDIDDNKFKNKLKEFSNCQGNTLKKVIKTLRSVNGAVPTRYLKKTMLPKQVKILSDKKFITIDLYKKPLIVRVENTESKRQRRY